MTEAPPEATIVVPMHVPRRYRRLAPLLFVLVDVTALSWMIFEGSLTSYAVGGLLLLSSAWIAVLMVTLGRGGTPMQLVLSNEGLAGPAFSIHWEQIESVEFGEVANQRALIIEPHPDAEVRWRSGVFRANARLARAMGMPVITILDANLDRSIFELAREMEARAGRPLVR
jgi:hypothetical protein